MIPALQSHDQLLADIRGAGGSDESFHLWWLGQSGFLLKWQGRYLLFDPYLSDSLTKKYADTDKPHVRMTELAIDPVRLDFIDVVTSSHHHTDHLDPETLRPLLAANPNLSLVVPRAWKDLAAERLHADPARMTTIDTGEAVEAAGFHLHAVPAAHESIESDENGFLHFLGYVVRFGPWTIYHSGDTVRYERMAEHLSRWQIDVALLPINGSKPERRVPGNLSGCEAVQLARDIDARLVIPCHFEMFEFNTVTPDEFIDAAEQLGQPYRVLRCGERFSSTQMPAGEERT